MGHNDKRRRGEGRGTTTQADVPEEPTEQPRAQPGPAAEIASTLSTPSPSTPARALAFEDASTRGKPRPDRASTAPRPPTSVHGRRHSQLAARALLHKHLRAFLPRHRGNREGSGARPSRPKPRVPSPGTWPASTPAEPAARGRACTGKERRTSPRPARSACRSRYPLPPARKPSSAWDQSVLHSLPSPPRAFGSGEALREAICSCPGRSEEPSEQKYDRAMLSTEGI